MGGLRNCGGSGGEYSHIRLIYNANLRHALQPYTAGFPRADIHALITPDLLHQIIKGTFKDHLVTWVGEYLVGTWGPTAAAKIMAEIDRR